MRARGFTLLETLIYIAIFALALSALVTIFRASLQTRSIALAQQAVLESKRVAETNLLGRLREAGGVTTPASGTTTSLVILSPTPAENPVTFALSNGRLTMKLGNGAAQPITGSHVTVTSFSVTRLAGSPATISVSIVYRAATASVANVTATTSFTFTQRL